MKKNKPYLWQALSSLTFSGVTEESWEAIAQLDVQIVSRFAKFFPKVQAFLPGDRIATHFFEALQSPAGFAKLKTFLQRRTAYDAGALLGLDPIEAPQQSMPLSIAYGGWSFGEVLQAGERLGLLKNTWRFLVGQSVMTHRSPPGTYELLAVAQGNECSLAPAEILLCGILSALKCGRTFPLKWMRSANLTTEGRLAFWVSGGEVSVGAIVLTDPEGCDMTMRMS